MKLIKSDNTFTKEPWFKYFVGEQNAMSCNLNFFDKDGYELTELEQKYAIYSGIDLSEKHNKHTAAHYWWYKDETLSEQGCVLDHSMIITRYRFEGEARKELERLVSKRPILNKLLSIRSKYGIDFSLDYVTEKEYMKFFI